VGLKDVSVFFHDLIAEGVNAHPDNDFGQYINVETNEDTYTQEEADVRNSLMKKSFEVCKGFRVDIYDLMQEIFLKETGLSVFIPLPSDNSSQD
jgi:hypothetical protein